MTQVEPKLSEEFTTREQELAALVAPLLTFNLEKEIERLRREEHWLKDGRISETLVKYSDFRIVLILMQAGTVMREHKADARISHRNQNVPGFIEPRLNPKHARSICY